MPLVIAEAGAVWYLTPNDKKQFNQLGRRRPAQELYPLELDFQGSQQREIPHLKCQ